MPGLTWSLQPHIFLLFNALQQVYGQIDPANVTRWFEFVGLVA